MFYFGMISVALLRIKDFVSFIHYADIYSATSRRQLLIAPDPSTDKTRNFLGEDKRVEMLNIFVLLQVSMLPAPYGDCIDAENYTFTRCTGQCLGEFTVSRCGCRLPFLDGINAYK